MEITKEVKQILTAAVEDCTGLWEAIWEVRSIDPNRSDEQIRGTALDAIRRLLSAGWIELVFGTEFEGEEKAVSPRDSESFIRQDAYWDVPLSDRSPHIRFTATDEGRRVWMSL